MIDPRRLDEDVIAKRVREYAESRHLTLERAEALIIANYLDAIHAMQVTGFTGVATTILHGDKPSASQRILPEP